MSTQQKSDDGGAAFPTPDAIISEELAVHGISHPGERGMTLRDYFAAKAMPIANKSGGDDSVGDVAKELGIDSKEYDHKIHWPMIMARRAYAIADAMLKARE